MRDCPGKYQPILISLSLLIAAPSMAQAPDSFQSAPNIRPAPRQHPPRSTREIEPARPEQVVAPPAAPLTQPQSQGAGTEKRVPSAPSAASPTDAQQNGWLVYSDSRVSRTIPCASQPILLMGNHTDISLKGACNYVRVAGEHNDINVEVGAAATIEITGAHNDVTWRQITPGPRPRLLNTNPEVNTFHPDKG